MAASQVYWEHANAIVVGMTPDELRANWIADARLQGAFFRERYRCFGCRRPLTYYVAPEAQPVQVPLCWTCFPYGEELPAEDPSC